MHFFVMRVVFYLYILFGVLTDFLVYRGHETWRLFPDEVHVYVILSVSLYCLMIVLNMYWFNRMMKGLLKGLGCLKDTKKSKQKPE